MGFVGAADALLFSQCKPTERTFLTGRLVADMSGRVRASSLARRHGSRRSFHELGHFRHSYQSFAIPIKLAKPPGSTQFQGE